MSIDPLNPRALAEAAGQFAVQAVEAAEPALPGLEGQDRAAVLVDLARACAIASAALDTGGLTVDEWAAAPEAALIAELEDECRRQDEQHGGFNVQGRDPSVSLRLALAVIEDEVVEALVAWRGERTAEVRVETREELLQVAACALRAVRDCFPEVEAVRAEFAGPYSPPPDVSP